MSEGMEFLKNNTPDGLDDLVNYFDSTYMSGSLRRIQPAAVDPDQPVPPLHFRQMPPIFSPEVWNTHNVTKDTSTVSLMLPGRDETVPTTYAKDATMPSNR